MLRAITEEDLPELLRVERASQIVPWSTDIFLRCFENHYDGWAIEIKDNKIAGFMMVSFMLEDCHILNLSIDPDFQRQGLGSQLLAYVVAYAKGRGAKMVYLEVRCNNCAAIALYEKAGFIQIGKRKNYYPKVSGREDALVFAKELEWL